MTQNKEDLNMDNNLQSICNLINDSCSNRVATFSNAETAKYTDLAIREGFLIFSAMISLLGEDGEIIGMKSLLLWKKYWIPISLLLGKLNFYNQFVESKMARLVIKMNLS